MKLVVETQRSRMKEFVVLLCCLAGASGFVLSVDEEEVEW